jgi:hypothetical protein
LGFAWLCLQSGGPWNVSREAIRLRAQRDHWRKILSVAGDAQQADDQPVVDIALSGKIAERLDEGKSVEVDLSRRSEAGQRASEFTELNDDLRNQLLDKHKKEWGSVARGLIYETVREAQKATGLNKGKLMKLVVDALRVLHQAEADAHGLQTLHVNWDSLSVEELRAIYEKGKLPS